ncbi:phosphodiester glycosidase family protein [Nonomuraea cypriaca]|uniref:phosphodiester glycosidase family protein n=1 Tax=Nonomuraea cypriaca TaxID=1187855 RepID=UPI002E2D43BA|nr:phosphodiester glycosidase family protein [Nonomuraea cypriaca]
MLLLAAAVVSLIGIPAQADAAPPDPVAETASQARLASSYLPAATPLFDAGTAVAGGPIETYRTDRPVADGMVLDSVDTLDPRGWQRSDALTIDLTKGNKIGYLDTGEVAATGRISEMAGKAGAVAAVNGDFFDINNSSAPDGVGIQDGKIVKSPSGGFDRAVTFDSSGIGRIMDVLFEGTVTLAGGEQVPLARLNAVDLPAGGIGAYDSRWGSYTRTRPVQGVAQVTEVLVADGTVERVTAGAGEGDIPEGATVLVGRDAAAARLARLTAGDPVEISYRVKPSVDAELVTAIGGHTVLVKDGVAQGVNDSTLAARMAVGFSADGEKMFMVTVDGNRTINSRGATLKEMADRLVELGANVGLEIDGGGSATMVTRTPGSDEVRIANEPNDGVERLVPNGLAVYGKEGSGRLRGLWVRPAIDPSLAPGMGPVPGGRPDRVFLGLTRTVAATGHDETYGPAGSSRDIRWSATHGGVDDGVFRAKLPGTATVTASSRSVRGSTKLEVLGPVARLEATQPSINIADASGSAVFGVVGYDEHGDSAPVEPRDVTLSYDTTLLDISPDATGGFTVASKKPSGAALVTVEIGDLTATVAVTVGVEKRILADFDNAAQWTAGSARGSATVTPAAEGVSGGGLKLAYDFTGSTATRTAYATSPQRLGLPGQTRAFGLSVYGRGQGEWTAIQVIDATGKATSVYGPYITWNGWQDIEFPVPTGLAQPVTVNRFYAIEIKADRQYASDVLIDELYAQVAPSIEQPPAAQVRDRLVSAQPGRDDWRFAVMSDAQFVARDPDSALVTGARRTLREIKAARPDFLVIAGDLVDEASEADFQLAKRILDEELGAGLPYYYVPGNHEVMGASIANFRAHFGDTNRTFDHKGTRFVTLDTSLGTIRGGGFDQIERLRTALDEAEEDDRIGSLVVIEHHPPRDPTPGALSQLADRKEAALVEQWLGDFQHRTGKGAAFIGGHVGTFSAARVDGVPYLINGNSAKTPSTAPGEGGFTGWSMLSVDPVSKAERMAARLFPFAGGPRWLAAQIRPHVDELAVTAPAQIALGASARVSATITQGARQVPVAYPIGVTWSGSRDLHVGDARSARGGDVAVFDPATGTLTARRPGTVTISATVGGVTREATITIVR